MSVLRDEFLVNLTFLNIDLYSPYYLVQNVLFQQFIWQQVVLQKWRMKFIKLSYFFRVVFHLLCRIQYTRIILLFQDRREVLYDFDISP